MKKKIYFLAGCCIFNFAAFSQTELGAEYQQELGKSYVSKSIGALYEQFNKTGKGSVQIALHYTSDIFRDNKGGSHGVGDFGLSFGYRYGFSYGNSGNLFSGVRATFSFLAETDHTKFTPSLEMGYHYTFNNFGKGGFATPSLAFGYDIPMGNKKAEDHKGPLLIPRLAAGYRF
jgi:hypothetical protein